MTHPRKNKPSLARRDFLKGATLSAASFMIVPRHVLGGVGYQAPSDTVNLAAIGAGGMGANNMSKLTGQNIVALADVDYARVKESVSRPERKELQQAYEKAKWYHDYRKMLEEQKDILLQFMDRAMKDGDKAKVKMLERRLKAVEAEARAQKNRLQERIDTLEDALAKERSQNARGRSIGLAVASSNVRPSAPSAPAGKRPVVAEMVHCGRRTITAQIEADKTRSRKSTFFSTKR